MLIRDERPINIPEIRKVVTTAFPGPQEARLVDRLSDDDGSVISLVAEDASVVGHVVLSRMSAPFRALGLGPVAVLPEDQRKGTLSGAMAPIGAKVQAEIAEENERTADACEAMLEVVTTFIKEAEAEEERDREKLERDNEDLRRQLYDVRCGAGQYTTSPRPRDLLRDD